MFVCPSDSYICVNILKHYRQHDLVKEKEINANISHLERLGYADGLLFINRRGVGMPMGRLKTRE